MMAIKTTFDDRPLHFGFFAIRLGASVRDPRGVGRFFSLEANFPFSGHTKIDDIAHDWLRDLRPFTLDQS